MGESEEALRTTRRLLLRNNSSIEALVVRAGALYQSGGELECTSAVQHLREALRLDPDHIEAKQLFKSLKRMQSNIKRGQEAAKLREFEESISCFNEVLSFPDKYYTSRQMASDDSMDCPSFLRISMDFC